MTLSLLIWCPPALCRVLNIHTTTLSDLTDFRQYVADEEVFYSHHTRTVRIDCAALRDEVVTVLKTGHLVLESSTPGDVQRERRTGTIEAWHQGRLLHLTNTALASRDEQQAWATSVRAVVTLQQQQDLAFLSDCLALSSCMCLTGRYPSCCSPIVPVSNNSPCRRIPRAAKLCTGDGQNAAVTPEST